MVGRNKLECYRLRSFHLWSRCMGERSEEQFIGMHHHSSNHGNEWHPQADMPLNRKPSFQYYGEHMALNDCSLLPSPVLEKSFIGCINTQFMLRGLKW